jgi:alpha-beta hydrolase superfamily lysophospholipase
VPDLTGLTLLDRPEITRLLFYPRPDLEDWKPPHAIDRLAQTDDGVSVGVRLYPVEADKPVILFFHGNGEIASDYDDVGPTYNRYGINFFVADYRGYGKSTGKPSASAVIHDAHAVFKDVTAWMEKNNYLAPLFIMGRSLGSAPALELVVSYQDRIQGLILESAFAQTLPLLRLLGIPVERLGVTEENCFGNERKIEQFRKPTLIIHAENDHIIPFHHAQTLMERSPAPDKELVMIPGANHNDILYQAGERYFEAINRFILRACRPQK